MLTLARAKELIETDWYSHGTLLNQLQAVEGFSYEASKYGADNCGADWKEEAVQEEEPETKILSPGEAAIERSRALIEQQRENIEYYRQLEDYYRNLYR